MYTHKMIDILDSDWTKHFCVHGSGYGDGNGDDGDGFRIFVYAFMNASSKQASRGASKSKATCW